jgi:hypothetical protein
MTSNNPRSNSIFHFTGKIDFLKSIIFNGFYPRYCREDMKWLTDENEPFAYPMVCFCDIPLSRIIHHIKDYGGFGIGLSKEWATRKNIHPVIYFSNGNTAVLSAVDFLLGTNEDIDDEEGDKRFSVLAKLIQIMKPMEGIDYKSNKNKSFHQENEWRYVTALDSEFNTDFIKNSDLLNKNAEKYKLDFTPPDVKYIFVEKDSDIVSMIEYINNINKFSDEDRKILCSKIISIETIGSDL